MVKTQYAREQEIGNYITCKIIKQVKSQNTWHHRIREIIRHVKSHKTREITNTGSDIIH